MANTLDIESYTLSLAGSAIPISRPSGNVSTRANEVTLLAPSSNSASVLLGSAERQAFPVAPGDKVSLSSLVSRQSISGTFNLDSVFVNASGGNSVEVVLHAPSTQVVRPNLAFNTLSLQLDDVSQFLDAGNIFDFEADDAFSGSFWIKFDDVGPGRDGICSKIEGDLEFVGYFFERTSGFLQFWMYTSPSTLIRVFSSVEVLTAGVWHHVGFTYDGSRTGAGVNLYLDGALVAKTVFTDNLGAGTIVTMRPFYLGRDRTSATTPQYLGGFLDESAMFDAELSGAQMSEIYNFGSPANLLGQTVAPDIAGYWRMGDDPSDDATSDVGQITDVSGNGNHLTPRNTTPASFVMDVP